MTDQNANINITLDNVLLIHGMFQRRPLERETTRKSRSYALRRNVFLENSGKPGIIF